MMETIIQAAAIGGPLLLAIMGLIVSIKPPKSEGRGHWYWFAAFFVVGGIAFLANFFELRSSDALQGKLSSKQDELNKKQDQLNDTQKLLSSQQKEMNEKLAEAKSAIDRLLIGQSATAQAAARVLTADAANRLISNLKPLVPAGIKVEISCTIGDARGCQYANQWLAVLKAAGWQANGVPQGVYMPPPIGIFITVNNPNIPGAGILQHALASVGTPAAGQIDEKIPSAQIRLLIGGN